MVRVPAAARRLTLTVIVEVPEPGALMDVGLKPTVTLEPVTVAERLTAELKPPLTAVVKVSLPVPEGETCSDAVAGERVKLGVAPVTVSVTVVVSTMLPDVAVTVMGYDPGVAPDVVNVKVDEAAPLVIVTGFALQPIVTPLGKVEVERATDPVNPLLGVTVTAVVFEPVCPTWTVVGDAETPKPGVMGPLSALIRAAVGLPQPVTRSKPVTAEKLPEVPLVMSWKSAA